MKALQMQGFFDILDELNYKTRTVCQQVPGSGWAEKKTFGTDD